MQLRITLWVMITSMVASVGCTTGTGNASKPTLTSITLSPQDAAVMVGKTIQFSAQAKYSDGSTEDITSTANWSSSDTSVATISAGVASGVKLGAVTIRVGSGSTTQSTLLNVTSKSFSNASLNGSYAFTLTAAGSGKIRDLETGSFQADGNGTLSGTEDVNISSGATKQQSFSGTYSVNSDGRGTLTLNSSQSRVFHFVLSSNSSSPTDNDGKLIEFDTTQTAIGSIEMQNESDFKNASLASSTYVFRIGGEDSDQNAISTIGAFTTDSTGKNIVSGYEDVNDNGNINGGTGSTDSGKPIAITGGSIDTIDSTSGRATATIRTAAGTSNFAFYVVSSSKVRVIELSSAPIAAGIAEKQNSPAPSSAEAGGYDFVTEIGGISGQFWIMGQFQLDSSGGIDNLVQNQAGGVLLNFAAPGTLNVASASDGRGTFQENTDQGPFNFTVYMVSASKMFFLETDDSHAASGVGEVQQAGVDGFHTGTLNNSFTFSAADMSDSDIALVAQVVADGLGSISGMEDVSQPEPGNPSQIMVQTVLFQATYSPPLSSGLTTANVGISPNDTGLQEFNLYLVSPNAALVLGRTPTNVNGIMKVQ